MKMLTVIISKSPDQDPRKHELEESILAALVREPDVVVEVMPHLYDLGETDGAQAVLRSVTGPLAVLAWLYPRAIHWTLDRMGVKGQCGETQLHRADLENEKARDNASAPDAPSRTIWSLDLRDGDDASMHAMMTGEIFEAMFRAQCAWDATMAASALKALKERGGEDGVVVVLVGEGHVAYGLGIERQAKLSFGGKVATVIPVPVLDDKGKSVKVRASYADFLWGVPRETDPLFPSLGLSTREVPGGKGESLPVIAVEKDGVAAAAGFKVADEILSMDGTALKDRETHARLMAGKRWGDSAEYLVKRGGETVSLKALFRRDPPTPCPAPKDAAPKDAAPKGAK